MDPHTHKSVHAIYPSSPPSHIHLYFTSIMCPSIYWSISPAVRPSSDLQGFVPFWSHMPCSSCNIIHPSVSHTALHPSPSNPSVPPSTATALLAASGHLSASHHMSCCLLTPLARAMAETISLATQSTLTLIREINSAARCRRPWAC